MSAAKPVCRPSTHPAESAARNEKYPRSVEGKQLMLQPGGAISIVLSDASETDRAYQDRNAFANP
jgi:hypothetical protein